MLTWSVSSCMSKTCHPVPGECKCKQWPRLRRKDKSRAARSRSPCVRMAYSPPVFPSIPKSLLRTPNKRQIIGRRTWDYPNGMGMDMGTWRLPVATAIATKNRYQPPHSHPAGCRSLLECLFVCSPVSFSWPSQPLSSHQREIPALNCSCIALA